MAPCPTTVTNTGRSASASARDVTALAAIPRARTIPRAFMRLPPSKLWAVAEMAARYWAAPSVHSPKGRYSSPMVRTWGLGFGAFGSLLLLATTANAAPSSRLIYVRDERAATCPDEAHFREAVVRRVGYDPFFAWATTTVVVEVTGESGWYTAHVRLVDKRGVSHGVRELRSGESGCSGLLDAAALAVSIALDMDSTEVSEPPPAPSVPGTPQPAPPEPVPTPPLPSSASRDSPAIDRLAPGTRDESAIRGEIGFDTLAAIAAAPDVVSGFDVWVGARRGSGSLGLELRTDAPDSPPFERGGQATVVLLAATLDPCVYAGSFFACALATVGWLHASGSGVLEPRSGAAATLALGPRAGVDLPLSRSFALRFRGDFSINAVRPTVSLNGAEWQLPRYGAVFAVGVAYRFP
jgi:hypothetical protein